MPNPNPPPKRKRSLNNLLAIMARLRSPSGCPWDREQTENSLKKFLIEEAYEALEAIEAGTLKELQEELGDLLLQIIFISRITEEKGLFDFSDVVHTLAEKLVRRHPHVFPPAHRPRVKVQDASQVIRVWGSVKKAEGKYSGRNSLLDGLPLALPALERARRLSERASRAGFDWPNIQEVWKKILEEMGELETADKESSAGAIEEELGDLLFTLVNWARFKGLSAEEALRKANRRFVRRFRQVEKELRRIGKKPEDSTLEEMDHLWEEAKNKIQGAGRPRAQGSRRKSEKR